MMTSEFFPLQEVTQRAEVAPVPDQSWWEEFGEWESASKASRLPAPQHVTCVTEPRLVIEDQIVRLPIARSDGCLPYSSFPGLCHAPTQPATSMHIMPEYNSSKVCGLAAAVRQQAVTPPFFFMLLSDDYSLSSVHVAPGCVISENTTALKLSYLLSIAAAYCVSHEQA